MLSPRIALRLLSCEELIDDPCPDACVEIVFGPKRPSANLDDVVIREPLRMTSAELLRRLHIESGLALGEIRAEALRAEEAWKLQLGHWYEEGRQAAEARTSDVTLLRRVLDGLRSLAPVSA